MATNENIRILIYEAFLPYAFKIERILFTNNYLNTSRETDLVKIAAMASSTYPEIIIVANKPFERKDVDLLHLLNKYEVNVPVIIFDENEEYQREIKTTYKNVFCINQVINQQSLIETIELIIEKTSTPKNKESSRI